MFDMNNVRNVTYFTAGRRTKMMIDQLLGKMRMKMCENTESFFSVAIHRLVEIYLYLLYNLEPIHSVMVWNSGAHGKSNRNLEGLEICKANNLSTSSWTQRNWLNFSDRIRGKSTWKRWSSHSVQIIANN